MPKVEKGETSLGAAEQLEGAQHVKQITLQRETLCLKRSDDNLKLPEGFIVGKAIGGGDCFFDSVAQGLKQLKPDMEFTAKSLREVCKRLAIDNQQLRDEFIKNIRTELQDSDISDDTLWNSYLCGIEYTSDDMNKMQVENPVLYQSLTSTKHGSALQLPIWGTLCTEGKLICSEYNIKIHLVEKYSINKKDVWVNQIINSERSRSVNSIGYDEENTIHIVNMGVSHFQPILSTQEIQHNKQQFPDLSGYDGEIEPKEELIKAIKNPDSEAHLLSKNFQNELTGNNCRSCLKNYTISDIAEHVYKWNESNNIIFGVEGCGSLSRKLDEFKKNKDKTLIYFINKCGNHWVTLIAIHNNRSEDIFFYADSFGEKIDECLVSSLGIGNTQNQISYGNKVNQYSVDRNSQNIEKNSDDVAFVERITLLEQGGNDNTLIPLDGFLESKGYSKNNIHSVSCKQQNDSYNCGIFALENAKAILNVVKDGNDDPAKVEESLEMVSKDPESLNTLRNGFSKSLGEIFNFTAAKKPVKKRFAEESKNLFSDLGNLLRLENCRTSRLKTIIAKFVKEHTKHNNPLSRLLLGQFLCKNKDLEDTYKPSKYLLLYPKNKSIAFLLVLHIESLGKVESIVLNVIENTEKDNSIPKLVPNIDISLVNSDGLTIFDLEKKRLLVKLISVKLALMILIKVLKLSV